MWAQAGFRPGDTMDRYGKKVDTWRNLRSKAQRARSTNQDKYADQLMKQYENAKWEHEIANALDDIGIGSKKIPQEWRRAFSDEVARRANPEEFGAPKFGDLTVADVKKMIENLDAPTKVYDPEEDVYKYV